MTAARNSQNQKIADVFHDWRAGAPCGDHDPDLFFDHAENNEFVARTAKNICLSCEIREKCLDAAMMSREDYGIWGGMDPDERDRYRPAWKRAKSGGVQNGRATRQRSGAMLNSAGVERHYHARLKAAQQCRAQLLAMPPFHRRDDLLTVLELIIAHPMDDAGTLARRAGYSKTWFNNNKRKVYGMFDISENTNDDVVA